MLEGKNTHFDENIVNAFMKISVYDILNVILSGSKNNLNTDEILLKEFNLDELYAILIKDREVITEDELRLIETFDKYYHYTI